MSDRVVVMNAGRISCQGTPEELYTSPGSSFAASFVGHNTVFSLDRAAIPGGGLITGLPGQERPFQLSRPLAPETSRVYVVIGSGHIRCHDRAASQTQEATVLSRRFTGVNHLITVRAGETIMTLPAPPSHPEAGDRVHVSWDPGDAHVIEEDAAGAVVGSGQVVNGAVPSVAGTSRQAVVGE
jgi:ABC-type Fe3+/spermidine/putrescine transport system ATPase subunit